MLCPLQLVFGDGSLASLSDGSSTARLPLGPPIQLPDSTYHELDLFCLCLYLLSALLPPASELCENRPMAAKVQGRGWGGWTSRGGAGTGQGGVGRDGPGWGGQEAGMGRESGVSSCRCRTEVLLHSTGNYPIS